MLSLFPADAPLPAPLTQYDPTIALPDFAERVARLRSWQQRIASGYVGSQKEEVLQAEFLSLVFGQALGYEHERPDYRQLLNAYQRSPVRHTGSWGFFVLLLISCALSRRLCVVCKTKQTPPSGTRYSLYLHDPKQAHSL